MFLIYIVNYTIWRQIREDSYLVAWDIHFCGQLIWYENIFFLTQQFLPRMFLPYWWVRILIKLFITVLIQCMLKLSSANHLFPFSPVFLPLSRVLLPTRGVKLRRNGENFSGGKFSGRRQILEPKAREGKVEAFWRRRRQIANLSEAKFRRRSRL